MFQVRITKYDPAKRNSKGYYLDNEWQEFSDVGSTFNGQKFTYDEYLIVENKYIRTVQTFLEVAHVKGLYISDLEDYGVSEFSQNNLSQICSSPSSLSDFV